MNIFRRIRNLYCWSECSPTIENYLDTKVNNAVEIYNKEIKPKFRPATIIDMSPPVDLDAPLNEEN